MHFGSFWLNKARDSGETVQPCRSIRMGYGVLSPERKAKVAKVVREVI